MELKGERARVKEGKMLADRHSATLLLCTRLRVLLLPLLPTCLVSPR